MTNWISYFVVIPLFPIITALALSLLKRRVCSIKAYLEVLNFICCRSCSWQVHEAI